MQYLIEIDTKEFDKKEIKEIEEFIQRLSFLRKLYLGEGI
jgi:hypothetical protein